ncbi:MAG: hypothetical protein LBT21_01820 [Oscillospiraceae bacterium]|jgi:hypothetical protein|nr:hypothetical protein [Oscillospiraceae bacterium]
MSKKKHPVIKAVLGTGLAVIVTGVGFVVWFGREENHRFQTAVTANDYSRILQENISGNPRVADIAMLCAHDAFSNKITGESALDPGSSTQILGNPLAKAIAKGVFARQAKAQKSDAYLLAQRGVRYFDTRVCWDGTQWQNLHSFISAPFEENLRYVLRFLAENPGELLVIDIQHHSTGNLTSADMLDFIGTVKDEDGKSLWDYVRFDPNVTALGDLRWQDATNGGAGVIVLVKTPQVPGGKYYEYSDNTVRAEWHNKPDIPSLVAGIESEYAYLTENFEQYKNAFRSNQAQSTPPLNLDAISYWSILRAAEDSNTAILAHPDFDKWLSVMPIIWVNNADTMVNGFNDEIVLRLNAYNRNLK